MINGDLQRNCLSNGSWSGVEPTCPHKEGGREGGGKGKGGREDLVCEVGYMLNLEEGMGNKDK